MSGRGCLEKAGANALISFMLGFDLGMEPFVMTVQRKNDEVYSKYNDTRGALSISY